MMPRLEKLREGFSRRLPQLQRALGACPRDSRLQAIEQMSPGLRKELLRHMEASKALTGEELVSSARKKAKQVVQQPRLSMTMAAEQTLDSNRGARKRRLQSLLPKASALKRTCLKPNLWTVATRCGAYHAARLTVAGITMVTRLTKDLQEAEGLQSSLQRLAETAHSGRRAHADCDAAEIQARLAEALRKEGPPLGLTFQVKLDLRQWVGKQAFSPVLHSIEEVMDIQGKLQEARKNGWDALRAQWVEWMSAPRQRQRWRRSMSVNEAESAAARAEVLFAASRAHALKVRSLEYAKRADERRAQEVTKANLRRQRLERQSSRRADRQLYRASTLHRAVQLAEAAFSRLILASRRLEQAERARTANALTPIRQVKALGRRRS